MWCVQNLKTSLRNKCILNYLKNPEKRLKYVEIQNKSLKNFKIQKKEPFLSVTSHQRKIKTAVLGRKLS